MQHLINYLFVIILAAALVLLIVSETRRLGMIAFGIMVLMVFVVNIQFWTFTFALVKLLSGLVAGLVLSFSSDLATQSIFGVGRTGKVFRGVALIFVLVLILFAVPVLSKYLTIPLEQILASLFVMTGGFILLGISQDPYRLIMGLITLFLGFEIIYGAVERSLLINGMLAAIVMLIALVGSYIINSSTKEVEE